MARSPPLELVDLEEAADDALIRLARQGDLQAFEKLMRRYQDRIYSFLLRWLRDRAAAEDVLQQTAVRTFCRLDRFRDGAAFRPWVFKIAVNEAKVFLRTERRARRRAQAVAQPSADPSTVSIDASIDAQHVLEKGLAALSASDRRLLLLRFAEGLSTSEVARVVGAPTLVVKMRVHRARHRFRRVVGELT